MKASTTKSTRVLPLTSKAKMPKASKASVAPVVAPAPAPVVTPAPAPVVALRGGPAVQAVRLTGKLYRSAAKHNTDWWALVTGAASAAPAPVADLLKAGVPSHFIGYTMRRGYLQAMPA